MLRLALWQWHAGGPRHSGWQVTGKPRTRGKSRVSESVRARASLQVRLMPQAEA